MISGIFSLQDISWGSFLYQFHIYYRWDLEKQEECGVVAQERLIEPHAKIEWLLAKPRSFSNLPAFFMVIVTQRFGLTLLSLVSYIILNDKF